MTGCVGSDGVLERRRRPRRPLFTAVLRWYPAMVAVFVVLVLVVSAFVYAPLWTLAGLAFYGVYLLARFKLPRDRFSWVFKKPMLFEFTRSVVLIAGVLVFLRYLYTRTDYLSATQGRDMLWLLVLIATFIVSEKGTTETLIGTLVVASASVTALELANSSFWDRPLLLTVVAKVLWLVFLSFVHHVQLRRVADWFANMELLNRVEEQLIHIRTIQSEEELLGTAVRQIADAFQYPHVNIFYLEANGALRCVAGACEQGRRLAQEQFTLEGGKGIIGDAIRTGTAHVANNTGTDRHYYPHPAFPDTQAELAVPIKLEGKPVGVLDIQAHHTNLFLEQDVAVAENLASYLGRAVDNIRLHTEVNRVAASRQRINEIVERIARRLLSHPQLEATLNEIALAAYQELRCDVVMLFELNRNTGQMYGPVYAGKLYQPEAIGAGPRDPGTLVYRLLTSERDYYHERVDDAEQDPLFGQSIVHMQSGRPPFAHREKIVSRAILHLRTETGEVGLMFLNYRSQRNFSDEDKTMFRTFANLAALAIQKAQSQKRLAQVEREDIGRWLHDLLLAEADAVERYIMGTLKTASLQDCEKSLLLLARNANLEMATDIRYLDETLRDAPSADLRQVVDTVVERAEKTYSVACEVQWNGRSNLVSFAIVPPVRLMLNEAFLNAIKHGQASRISLVINIADAGLDFTVRDNGIGFDITRIRPRGLMNIKERAARLGGEAVIESRVEEGTRIRVTVPITHGEGG